MNDPLETYQEPDPLLVKERIIALAVWLKERRLEVPALLLIDSLGPLSSIVTAGSVFFQQCGEILFGRERYSLLQTLLRSEDFRTQLRHQIEPPLTGPVEAKSSLEHAA